MKKQSNIIETLLRGNIKKTEEKLDYGGRILKYKVETETTLYDLLDILLDLKKENPDLLHHSIMVHTGSGFTLEKTKNIEVVADMRDSYIKIGQVPKGEI